MKKLAIALVALVSTQVWAMDGSSGCGAGWYLFQKNSLVSSYSRSMTNFTFSNTIGMTFGTSNCAKHDLVQKEKEGQYYAEANYPNLMVETAQGAGEHLQGYAAALGCSNTSHFGTTLKKSYRDLIPETGGDADRFHNQVEQLIQSDPVLSKECDRTLS